MMVEKKKEGMDQRTCHLTSIEDNGFGKKIREETRAMGAGGSSSSVSVIQQHVVQHSI